MENTIRINANNYKQYAPVVPVAYSFAEPGACGAGGEIIIVNKEGKLFCLNFIRGDMSEEQIEELCPVITSTVFHLFGQGDTPPAGWIPIYLSLGNHLCVSEEYYPSFAAEGQERGIVSRGQLYQQWADMMQAVMKVKNPSEAETQDKDESCSCGCGNTDTVAENSHVMFEGGYTIPDLMKKG